jgi:hypothetical protein
VFHLEGGILKYLEAVPEEASRWQGDCFVFDKRVSVGHGLAPGHHQLCRSCRMPLGAAELASPHYVAGVSCPYCHGTRTPEQERALAEGELWSDEDQFMTDAVFGCGARHRLRLRLVQPLGRGGGAQSVAGQHAGARQGRHGRRADRIRLRRPRRGSAG